MVHFRPISIFLLPILKILGSEFWNDVDTVSKELSNSEDLSTQATTNEAQQVAPSTEHSHSNDRTRIKTPKRRYNPKWVSFQSIEMIPFRHAVTIDRTYPQNLSDSEIVNKLMELGDFHEWPLLRSYDVEDYSKYWGYVCTFFAKVNFTSMPGVACKLMPTFGKAKQRLIEYWGRKQVLDLLGCNCYGFRRNVLDFGTSIEKFLIHQGNANEFFVFKQEKMLKHVRLTVKDFKGGVSLPYPFEFKNLE